MKFDGYNLSLEEIQVLVDLGDNPTNAKLQSIGLEQNGIGGWDVVNTTLFEKAQKTRTIYLDSSDAEMFGRMITRRMGKTNEEG